MTTITFDEEIKLEKTHFKNLDEFKKFIGTTKYSLSKDFINENEAEYFEWEDNIGNMNTLSINSISGWNNENEDEIWK